MRIHYVHYLWFREGCAGAYCCPSRGVKVTWNKREVECPRCLEYLERDHANA